MELLNRLVWFDSPKHGRILYKIIEDGLACPVCGGNDGLVFEILADNSVGLDNEDGYHLPNRRIGIKVKGCQVTVEGQFRTDNTFRLIPPSQESTYLRLIEQDQG